jgi:hypothetical protein
MYVIYPRVAAVTPISTATNRPGSALRVPGRGALAILIKP